MSILKFITGLYERIPSFMTSYVEKIMSFMFVAYSMGGQATDLFEAWDVLIQKITRNVSTEVCVESLSSCWSSLEHERKVCTVNGRFLI
jgi:hypothetical protein